jgi:hypothetical protein
MSAKSPTPAAFATIEISPGNSTIGSLTYQRPIRQISPSSGRFRTAESASSAHDAQPPAI